MGDRAGERRTRRAVRPSDLLVVAASVVIGCIALEIVFAVAPPGGIYVYVDEMGFRVRPYATWGAWRTNALGCNDRDHTEAKAAGVRRVIVLGDSFNWAGGLDGNYTRVLERRLAELTPDAEIELLNLGYPGTHPGEELALLRRDGMRFAPDLVLLGVAVGNDFLDAQPWRRVIPVGGELTPIDLRREPVMMLFGAPFTDRSHLWRFLAGRLAILRLRLSARARGEHEATGGARLPDDAFHALERERMQVVARAPNATIATGEATVFASIAAMHELTAAAGARLAVAAYPEPFQVDDELRDAVLAETPASEDDFEWDRPQRTLRDYCRAHDLDYVDLLPAFRAAHDEGTAVYLHNEPHWNDAGQALAARELAPVVLRDLPGP